MENSKLPWKDLISPMSKDDAVDTKAALMFILQNFAQFSIDPSKVEDVICLYLIRISLKSISNCRYHHTWNDLKHM